MRAFEPLIDLCMDAGVGSPELESLVRALFVRRARDRLIRGMDRRAASDVRVALATGVHRNFVREILADEPGTLPIREARRPKSARLLEAWHSNLRYLDSSSRPRELPIRRAGRDPSFAELVSRYLPGVAAGAALSELRRGGAVELLPDERVRPRTRKLKNDGVDAGAIGEAARTGAHVLQTLFGRLSDAESRQTCEEVGPISLEMIKVPLALNVIASRTRVFVQALRAELDALARPKGGQRQRARHKVQLGLTACSWTLHP
jgi:hypothetical protein